MSGRRSKWSWLRRGVAFGLGMTAVWLGSLTVEFPTPKTVLENLGQNPEFVVATLSSQLGWEESVELFEEIGPWGRLLLDQSAFLSGGLTMFSSGIQESQQEKELEVLPLPKTEDENGDGESPVEFAPLVGENVVQHTSLGDESENYQWLQNACLQNTAGVSLDADALSQVQLAFSSEEGPQILIYHTHGSEAYTQTEDTRYVESDSYRTTDCQRNVVRVGEEMAQVFRTQGFQVIHDTTLYDYPIYNGAYERSRKGVELWLEQYPTIRVILDVHRDALVTQEGAAYQFIAQEGEDTVAQVMLVVGSDAGGAEHSDWEQNLALALDLQNTLAARYHQLVRPIALRSSRFNQHLSGGALLVEVGGHGNTLPQAIEAARMFAKTTGARLKVLAQLMT